MNRHARRATAAQKKSAASAQTRPTASARGGTEDDSKSRFTHRVAKLLGSGPITASPFGQFRHLLVELHVTDEDGFDAGIMPIRTAVVMYLYNGRWRMRSRGAQGERERDFALAMRAEGHDDWS